MLYDRKHFCSVLTNQSNLSRNRWTFLFHQKFPLLSSDLENVLTKHFPKIQPFANVLQNWCYYKFPNICKKILFLIKLPDWWPATLLKNRPQHRCFPVNITKCLRKAFFMEHLGWLLLKMVEGFLRILRGGLTHNDLHDFTNLNV